jgi:nucleobase:cation symporter-1, NCS1 family
MRKEVRDVSTSLDMTHNAAHADEALVIGDSDLFNEDLAPIPLERRTWSMWNIAALWVGMSVCIPTYMLASSLITGGMNWWQAILTVFLGNLIVLIPMVLNAHAGTKYGITFPVFARASFGVLGANVPAILRAIVACGWFGIQTWIGGWAIYKLGLVAWPGLAQTAMLGFLGINIAQLICFLAFWALNVWIFWRGMETIRVVED